MPHVAFVPFTGLRLREESLLELGMSLPSLRRRGEAIGALPALGLLTLAGMTPDDWSRSWHDASGAGLEVLDEVARARPTLVAVSALTASIDAAYAFADAARATGLRVVIGGLHVTACPDEARRHADAVVAGDGEPVWLDVLAHAAADELRPLYRARAPFDLARAPSPAFDLLPAERPRTRFTLQTERGCPFACSFCAASRLLGPFREKPLAQVADELRAIHALDPRPLLELADDNTFAGRRDPRGLLDVLQASGARWFTESDWRIGEDPELLEGLARSGCVQVLVGIESLVHRHAGMGRKDAELPRVLAAVEAIQAAGVVVNGCFVVGADGETRRSLDALGELLDAAPFGEVQLTLQTPFPGAPLRRQLERDGRLLERGWSSHTLFDMTYRPDRLTVEELERGFVELVARAFAPAETARRDGIRRAVWRRARRREEVTS